MRSCGLVWLSFRRCRCRRSLVRRRSLFPYLANSPSSALFSFSPFSYSFATPGARQTLFLHSPSAMFPSIATRQLATNTASSLRHLPYSVPRNSKGSLPVYSDIRNGGSRYLILLKNIKGDINVCLFISYPPSSHFSFFPLH